MAISCDPTDLANAAACFRCYDELTQKAVQTYLLALNAGVDPDPTALAALAKGFRGVVNLDEVNAFLLCQIANL